MTNTSKAPVMQIEVDDPARVDVCALLEEHLRSMHALSPPESVHALDVSRLKAVDITFWSVREAGVLLGCGALRQLSLGHGEIKSMCTPQALRRKGAGRAVLNHILAEARRRGYHRVSLETGPAHSFAAAHQLYRSAGFELCGPFGDYQADPYSVFMTLALRPLPFEQTAAHTHFAADFFNRAWDLIDKPDRTPGEDRLMVLFNQASICHWLHRDDCTDQNLSVGFWQASRIQALLGRAEEARLHAQTCLTYSQALAPFYLGYAYEALARAQTLAGELLNAGDSLQRARDCARAIDNPDHRELLCKDLDALDRANPMPPATRQA